MKNALVSLLIFESKSQSGNRLDFIGTLEKIYTDADGEVMLDLRWFYRPEVGGFFLWGRGIAVKTHLISSK